METPNYWWYIGQPKATVARRIDYPGEEILEFFHIAWPMVA
jgi:hypothetical protein